MLLTIQLRCGCCRRRRRDHSNVVKRNNKKTARFSRLKRVLGKKTLKEQAIETADKMCGKKCETLKEKVESQRKDLY
ncbi:hypothetical protein PRIPAC_95394 [Pristionchus pacificus]|uniref:Uncharacterized protein n=1 Tax=Pristionchus pacificus TaxID=54126 RepID=A0A2A6D143_PRIPA|nr:hypothetical protein PRIPAC_95394 [Pristionchus pacificus]|eukprot:PDM84202.1 hypothetical protein PRIPAC_33225 [Pristionchus pacificus]